MSPQVLDNLDSLRYRGTEMTDTHRKITDIDVIGTYPDLDQLVHQFFHDMCTIVDPAEQDRLISQRYTRIGQPGTSSRRLFGNFVRMVEMSIQPNRMIFPKHIYQFRRNALG